MGVLYFSGQTNGGSTVDTYTFLTLPRAALYELLVKFLSRAAHPQIDRRDARQAWYFLAGAARATHQRNSADTFRSFAESVHQTLNPGEVSTLAAQIDLWWPIIDGVDPEVGARAASTLEGEEYQPALIGAAFCEPDTTYEAVAAARMHRDHCLEHGFTIFPPIGRLAE